MAAKITISAIILSFLFCACKNNKASKTETLNQRKDSITKIEINLWPAFNHPSVIQIDKSAGTVQYKVDTMQDWPQKVYAGFSISLDSFETNTLVDSFYSQSFLDSIKFKPGNVIRDGLDIFTIIKKGNIIDTIGSGNVYPRILTDNILSQLNYISKNTSDKSLLNYIKDLKGYFHIE